MTPFDPTALGTAAVGVIAGVVGSWVALRKDSQARAAALSEATETIKLLREQTGILKEHGERREAEWRRLERPALSGRRAEKRIEAVEGDYRRLVFTVTSMGLCANAPGCAHYNPGERRRRGAQPSVLDMPLE